MTQSSFAIPSSIPTDEQTALMSNAALGCYIKLLCFAWREGSIPSDLARIAKLCGEPLLSMQTIWPQLSPCFSEDIFKPGRLMHSQLEDQRAAAKATKSAKSAAGSIGAQKRWSGHKASVIAGAAIAAASGHAVSPTPGPVPAPMPTTTPAARIPAVASIGSRPLELGNESGSLFPDELPVVVPKQENGPPPCPQSEIIALYHELMPTCPRVLTWHGTREGHLRTRWREMSVTKQEQLGGYRTAAEGLVWWRTFFEHCSKSPLLTGRVPPKEEGKAPFISNLEWIVKPANFAKILEGNYHRGLA